MKKIKKIDPLILHSRHEWRPFSLDATFLQDGQAKPVILHIHGFKGFKDWGYFNQLADYAAGKGFVFIKMNFSHNGTTPECPLDFVDLEAFGNNNFSIEQDDMGLVIDHIFAPDFPVARSEMDLDRFFLTGHSRGGAAVILKGDRDERVKAIASWAGVNDLGTHFTPEEVREWKENGVMYIENSRTKQQMPMYYQIVEDYIQNEQHLSVPLAIRKMRTPLLVIHGSEDTTVPAAVARQTAKWNPAVKLRIIQGADHVFGGAHPWRQDSLPSHAREMIDSTMQFFEAVR